MDDTKESELSLQIRREQQRERQALAEKREAMNTTGEINIRFIYHPPFGQWEGLVLVHGTPLYFLIKEVTS